jgi:2-methylisocitrate lyase-like PEP mutase family enzyme
MTGDAQEPKPCKVETARHFYIESEDDIRQIEGLASAIQVIGAHPDAGSDYVHAIGVEIEKRIKAIRERGRATPGGVIARSTTSHRRCVDAAHALSGLPVFLVRRSCSIRLARTPDY